VTDLSVYFAALRAAGQRLGSVGDDIDTALTELRTALGGGDVGAGNDELGAPFGQAYQPLVEQATTAIASYQQQVAYASWGLDWSAELQQKGETFNTQDMAELHEIFLPPRD
jgi:hypothetical protein